MSSKQSETEDLAIQDTLSMNVQDRLELLANLIVGKITEDEQDDYHLIKAIGPDNG